MLLVPLIFTIHFTKLFYLKLESGKLRKVFGPELAKNADFPESGKKKSKERWRENVVAKYGRR